MSPAGRAAPGVIVLLAALPSFEDVADSQGNHHVLTSGDAKDRGTELRPAQNRVIADVVVDDLVDAEDRQAVDDPRPHGTGVLADPASEDDGIESRESGCARGDSGGRPPDE